MPLIPGVGARPAVCLTAFACTPGHQSHDDWALLGVKSEYPTLPEENNNVRKPRRSDRSHRVSHWLCLAHAPRVAIEARADQVGRRRAGRVADAAARLVECVRAVGMVKTYTLRGSPAPDIMVAGTAEQIARGEHLAYALCAICHSLDDQLPLSGGRDVGKDSPVSIGELIGANLSGGGGGLTPAGPNLAVVRGWTQDQFITTMRTGVDPGGHALDPRQMPWESIGKLDDVELVALYEYLRGLTPIQE